MVIWNSKSSLNNQSISVNRLASKKHIPNQCSDILIFFSRKTGENKTEEKVKMGLSSFKSQTKPTQITSCKHIISIHQNDLRLTRLRRRHKTGPIELPTLSLPNSIYAIVAVCVPVCECFCVRAKSNHHRPNQTAQKPGCLRRGTCRRRLSGDLGK